MKKKVLSTIVLPDFFSSTLAQNEDNEIDEVSCIRAGWQWATLIMDGAKPYSASALSRFYVGFFNENKIVPLFHFGKGLEYLQN